MKQPRFQYLRRYVYQQQVRHQARAWLRANDERIVAMAMFHLNHFACDHSSGSSYIYQLKNCLVQTFYERGFCSHINLQIQRLTCWSCEGTGEYWPGEICWKCGGTGIYREHVLYQFTFNVHGRRYVWHQPKSLVTWPIERPTMGGYYRPRENHSTDRRCQDVKTRELYAALVYEYLIARGISSSKLPPLMALRQTLRREWRETKLSYRFRKERDISF